MLTEKERNLLDYPLFEKGYGIASKYILCDPGLSVAAKGDYCYKRSLCGTKDESVFPGVFRIMEDLSISKKLYYKARGELLNAGIIIIKRNKKSGVFDNNLYEFPLQPDRYMVASDSSYIRSIAYDVKQYGVMAKYGLCPFLVMSDKEIHVGAKVLFTYISAHINISEKPYTELYPKLIQYHLGMSSNTYKKYLAELKAHNLVIVRRVREGGAFKETNRYAINYALLPASEADIPADVLSFPDVNAPKPKKGETVKAPKPKKEETVEAPTTKKGETVEAPTTKKEEMVKAPTTKKEETAEAPTTKKGEMVKGETKKEETTITSSTITSFNQIILDGLMDTIRKKIDYPIFIYAGESTPQVKEMADLLVKVIAEAVSSPNAYISLNGQPLLTETVRDTFMQVNCAAAMNVIIRSIAKADSIRNMENYLRTSIYNEIQHSTDDEEDDYLYG